MSPPLHHRALGTPPWARVRAALPVLPVLFVLHCSTAPPGSTPAGGTLAARFLDAALACDPAGNFYVAGTELFGEARQIFLAHSNRYGETWSPRFAYVNSSRDGERGRPQLATGGPGEVYVLWEDTRHGRIDLFFNRSVDGGTTWLASDLQITSGLLPPARLTAPLLRCDRYGNVYVAWRDESAGYEAFYINHSADRGATWPAAPVAITSVSTAAKSAPSLVCDDNGALVLGWSEAVGNDFTVQVTTSTDHGTTWEWQAQVLGRPLVGTYLPRPALAMSDAGVAFAAFLASAPTPAVVLARSRDRGRTWDPPQELPARRGRTQLPTPPQLHTDRFGSLYVAWQAIGADGAHVFVLQTSTDDGATWNETRVPRTGGWYVVARAGFQEPLAAPFRSTADAAGNFYLTWTEGDTGIRGVGFDRVSNRGTQWLGTARSIGSASHLPLTLEAPLLCADDAGHVALLWNEGHTLSVATSPFYGDSGWHLEQF